MNNKHILFIDDEDITHIVDKLRHVLQKQGITLVEHIFPINGTYRINDPRKPGETMLDFNKIKEDLKTTVMTIRFDYVACDFNFKDKDLNGYKLVKWLKNVSKNEARFKIRGAKFSLFSSEIDKSIKETFSEEQIGILIRLKLEDFYDRARISEDLGASIINSSNEIDLKEKLISELDKHKDLKFKSGYPKFKDLKLDDIATEIQGETYHGIGFQEALIELCVAHMINLNEE